MAKLELAGLKASTNVPTRPYRVFVYDRDHFKEVSTIGKRQYQGEPRLDGSLRPDLILNIGFNIGLALNWASSHVEVLEQKSNGVHPLFLGISG